MLRESHESNHVKWLGHTYWGKYFCQHKIFGVDLQNQTKDWVEHEAQSCWNQNLKFLASDQPHDTHYHEYLKNEVDDGNSVMNFFKLFQSLFTFILNLFRVMVQCVIIVCRVLKVENFEAWNKYFLDAVQENRDSEIKSPLLLFFLNHTIWNVKIESHCIFSLAFFNTLYSSSKPCLD